MWMLLALLTSDADAGKAERDARRELRAVRRHTQVLTDSADDYWRALRWADYTRAGAHIADPKRRADWVIQESERASLKIQSAEVLSILVGEPDEYGSREATVLVQIEGYSNASQKLTKETRTQEWVLLTSGWFVGDGEEYGVLPGER